MISSSFPKNIPASLINNLNKIDSLPEENATELRLVAAHYVIDTCDNLEQQLSMLELYQETLHYGALLERRVLVKRETSLLNFSPMFREVRKELNQACSCLSSFYYSASPMEDEVLLLALRHLNSGYRGFLLMESEISEMNKVVCSEMRATPSILAVPKLSTISEE